MSKEENNQKELINIAMEELTKALNEARQGRAPTKSFDKLKKIYDTLSEAEKKRTAGEITDEDMQNKVEEEIKDFKKGI